MHDPIRNQAADIEAIRRFNRFYTQKIGVLREGLLGSPFSLTEARVLYELATRERPSASALIADLALDAGYVSRILKRFERNGYLVRRIARDDSRRRELSLTAAGRRAFARIDDRSRRDLSDLIKPLDAPLRAELIAAMRTIHAALDPTSSSPAPVVLRSHRPGDIGWVVQRHGELYAREYRWNDEFEALVARIAGEFIERFDAAGERCWIAERGARRIGCVFVVRESRTVAKLRMLLVEPEARGTGLGRRLVEQCLAFARKAGYRKLALWTQHNLRPARALYASCGFRLVDARKHHAFGHDLVAETWELRL